tara:strand:- start:43 stop:171 length:129 start_codon:yes stop_codon:yes gene_type:complete
MKEMLDMSTLKSNVLVIWGTSGLIALPKFGTDEKTPGPIGCI